MFCVVTVTDVQPEIRPEVTGKIRKSFENPLSLRLAAWPAADYPDITDWRTVVGFADMRNLDEIEVL
jgi:hypothetical protein